MGTMKRERVQRHPGVQRRTWVDRGGRERTLFDAQYRDPSGHRHTHSFERLGDADRWLRDQRTALDRGVWIDPALGRITFARWAKEWWATTTHLRPSSRARTEHTLGKHLVPRFGADRLASIRPTDVRAFVADLSAKGLAPATVRKVYTVLAQILRAAEESGLIGRSPCLGVKLPAPVRAEPRFLSPEEIATLAAAIDARYRAMILLAAYGGLRFGEIAGLRVERVDFLRSRLTVEEAIVEVRGELHRGPTKTGPARQVTLPRFVTEAIAAHLAASPAGADGLVFRDPAGGPIRRTNFRRRFFIPAVVAAGLGQMVRRDAGGGRTRMVYEGIRFHDLRHTAATLAIAAGAHPKAIQERLGHSSITTTLDRYGHLFPALDEELAERLDEMGRISPAR